MKLKGELKAYEVLNEKEQAYYNYTCQPGDIIRMCNIPSPHMTEEDLTIEKKYYLSEIFICDLYIRIQDFAHTQKK